MGQLIGAGIQLTIRQLLLLEYHRGLIRRPFDLRLEELVDARVPRKFRFCVVPLDQQMPQFRGRQQRQFCQG